ncbi:MAG: lysophospholipase L1-like esterase, partial [Saprospiraceae bacterium]
MRYKGRENRCSEFGTENLIPKAELHLLLKNKNPAMKNLKLSLTILLFFISMIQFSYAQDWANFERFKKANAALESPAPNEQRIVFMGNSITEGWARDSTSFFFSKSYINRGISGQTTPQMLVRFRADVIDLEPSVVVILAGINDIAGNTGPSSLKMIADNIKSMAELAKANGIKVILCSVLPAFDFPWKPGLNPAENVVKLNSMIKAYADKNSIVYLDYFKPMADHQNGLKAAYTYDGVHPNLAGYKVMEPLAEEAIAKVLEG